MVNSGNSTVRIEQGDKHQNLLMFGVATACELFKGKIGIKFGGIFTDILTGVKSWRHKNSIFLESRMIFFDHGE